MVKIPYPDPYRPVLGADRDPADAVLDYLENYILRTICPPEDTAGIIVEPMQSDGGDIVPPPRFLAGAGADLPPARHHAADRRGEDRVRPLRPDVRLRALRRGPRTRSSLGKSMGGGMPISAVVGRHELLDVAPAINMYTMAGNPVACAAALAHLDEIERLGLVGAGRAHRRTSCWAAARAAAAAPADRGRARAGPDAGPGDRARPARPRSRPTARWRRSSTARSSSG